jgi:hypothetical protein
MTTTTTTIQIPGLPRRSSMGIEAMHPDGSSPSQKRSDQARKGKGKAKQTRRGAPIAKTFSPERLVSKLDSALDFVTG